MKCLCGEPVAPDEPRCCEHLVGPDAVAGYHQRLIGVGAEAELVCARCSERGAPATVASCATCRQAIVDERGNALGTSGAPGITVAPAPFDASVRTIELAEAAIDHAPIPDAPGVWVLLEATGALRRLDVGSGGVEPFGQVSLVAEPGHEPWTDHALRHRLHVSGSGRFVAITNDYGRHGAVFDRETSSYPLTLDGGDYHPNTVPFSFAFVERGGRAVAIHRTGWNRLDASDAETGARLTERGPTDYVDGEPPAHYLDFFHGRLHTSPSGRHVVDDGWIWHPVGVPALWRVDRWLGANPWESEDGPSRRWTCARDYYWDHGMCWVDDRRLAIEGLGDDDLAMIDGVILYDVEAPSPEGQDRCLELSRFTGPRGQLFSDGQRLFSSDERGLRIWDLAQGALSGQIDGFRPSRQHRVGRQLAELYGSTLRVWSY